MKNSERFGTVTAEQIRAGVLVMPKKQRLAPAPSLHVDTNNFKRRRATEKKIVLSALVWLSVSIYVGCQYGVKAGIVFPFCIGSSAVCLFLYLKTLTTLIERLFFLKKDAKKKPMNSEDRVQFKRLKAAAFGQWDFPYPPTNDDAAWKRYKEQCFSALKSHEARLVWDEAKKVRYEWRKAEAAERSEALRLNSLATEVKTWLRATFSKLQAGHYCVDNERWADASRPSQRKRYFKKKSNGCCGSCDIEAICPYDGKKYLIGFNYGH